ncbi:MAG: hypothetical protein FE78DRAFT_87973 [Acidomyces sp. 'richmondensis']|nr:MAG: hypothetical protein FE78DRAFT_87973 [Acidomyces sp. 'richmondensis']
MSLNAVYFDPQKEYVGQNCHHPFGEIDCYLDRQYIRMGEIPTILKFVARRYWAFLFLPACSVSYNAKLSDPQIPYV